MSHPVGGEVRSGRPTGPTRSHVVDRISAGAFGAFTHETWSPGGNCGESVFVLLFWSDYFQTAELEMQPDGETTEGLCALLLISFTDLESERRQTRQNHPECNRILKWGRVLRLVFRISPLFFMPFCLRQSA